MHPVKYAVHNASTPDEMLERLSSFLQYLHALDIASVLPRCFDGLSARNAEEVRAWSAKLAQRSTQTEILTAAGDLWLNDVRDAFAAAVERLDELAIAQRATRR